eukprot:892883-Pyramimonas_sp.AAC.1
MKIEGPCGPGTDHTSKATRTKHGRSKAADELQIVTLNGNSWWTAVNYVKNTSAQIVLIQEHKLSLPQQQDQQQKLLGIGWRSFLGPA